MTAAAGIVGGLLAGSGLLLAAFTVGFRTSSLPYTPLSGASTGT